MKKLVALILLLAVVSAADVYFIRFEKTGDTVTSTDVFLQHGEVTHTLQPRSGYQIKVLSDEELYSFKFSVPSFTAYDDFDSNETGGGIILIDETHFGLLVPYFEEATTIDVYDNTGNKIESIDVSMFTETKKGISREYTVGQLLWPIVVLLAAVGVSHLYKKKKEPDVAITI